MPAFPDVPTVKEFLPDAKMWGDPFYLATYLVTTPGVDEATANYLTQLFISCAMDEEFQQMANESGFIAQDFPTGDGLKEIIGGFYNDLITMNGIFE